jgi:hypothetical protein
MVSGLDAKEYRSIIDAKLSDTKNRNENFDDVLMTPLRVATAEEETEAVKKEE